MLVFICSIFLLLSLTVAATTYRRVLTNPLVVFFSVWLLMFIGYELDRYFGYFAVRITPHAEVLYLLAFLSFFIGGVLILLGRFNRPLPLSRMTRMNPLTEIQMDLLYKWTKIVVLVLFCAVAIKYALLVQKGYMNPFSMLYEIRRDFVSGVLTFPAYFGLITVLGNVAIVNLAILLASPSRFRWAIVMLVIVFVCAFANDATTADKGSLKQVVLLVAAVTISGAVFGNQLRLKQLIGYGVVSVAFFGLLSVITLLRIRGPTSLLDVTVRHLYGDIIGNAVAFSEVVKHPFPSPLPGWNIFNGCYMFLNSLVTSALGFPMFNINSADLKASYYVDIVNVGVYNTSSDLAYYYSDFGILGVVIFPFMIGVASMLLFVKSIRSRNIQYVQLLALVLVALVFSVRGVYFGAAGFWITIAVIIFQNNMLIRTTDIAVDTVKHSAQEVIT